MSGPTVIAAGEGEIIGDAPDRRVEILAEDDALHATWTRFGALRDGASPHVHHHHTDLFYVLQGTLAVKVGPDLEERLVPAGNLVVVPPLVVHGFRNGAEDELRYLNFHAPGQGFADYMRGLRDGEPVDFDQDEPPADGGRPASEATIVPAADGVLADLGGVRIGFDTLTGGEIRVDGAQREWMYVLDGEVRIGEVAAEAGAWVSLGPRTSCAVASSDAAPARVLRLTARTS